VVWIIWELCLTARLLETAFALQDVGFARMHWTKSGFEQAKGRMRGYLLFYITFMWPELRVPNSANRAMSTYYQHMHYKMMHTCRASNSNGYLDVQGRTDVEHNACSTMAQPMASSLNLLHKRVSVLPHCLVCPLVSDLLGTQPGRTRQGEKQAC
jgi:hypothetical protein